MKLHLVAATVLALGTTVALAQEAPEADAAQAPAPADVTAVAAVEAVPAEAPAAVETDESAEIVCRTQRITGSLTRRQRACMTRAEWEALEGRTRDTHNAMTRGASGGQCVSANPTQGRC